MRFGDGTIHEELIEDIDHNPSDYYALWLGKDPYHSAWVGEYRGWHIALGEGAFKQEPETVGAFASLDEPVPET